MQTKDADMSRDEETLARDVVAIDGPSGAGKSTIARAVAARLGFVHLDTGAMYRAVALHLRERGCASTPDDETIAAGLRTLELDLDTKGHVRLRGHDVGERLRERSVEELVSAVAASPAVRERMVVEQRRFAARAPCVVEGRDMGTVVFPGARWKFYLDASVDERARRRQADFAAAGRDVSIDAVRAEIEARDARDRGRAVAPLRCADDATVIDTTDRTIDAIVETIVDAVHGEERGP